jgi:hypothetical protein
MTSRHKVWRVRGVPDSFDRTHLADILQSHPDLQCPYDSSTKEPNHNGAVVNTLAPDIVSGQVATVCFRQIPTQLANRGRSELLSTALGTQVSNKTTNNDEIGNVYEQIVIEDCFDGITVLYSPTSQEHEIDILAIPDIGGHAYGSFVNRQDGHMWLSDSLPKDLPGARVMVYGEGHGLPGNNHTSTFRGLALSFYNVIGPLLRTTNKPLVLIGHGLGGLLIKEAVTRIHKPDQSNLIHGLLFFGVPTGGLDMEPIIAMAKGQPNRFLVESLVWASKQTRSILTRWFSDTLERMNIRLVCFYEVGVSPTAIKVKLSSYLVGFPSAKIVSGPSYQ